MASYQVRQRDPLFDQDTQAVLERRGKELVGGLLVVFGLLAAMMLFSYHPEDPSWMAASDEPVQNWLGRIGAGIASPLFVIVGHGAWLLPAALVAWGLRMITHRGEERLVSRMIFFPIAVAVASVYAALLVPGDQWGQAFGLGGHFGDMIAGAMLGIVPISGVVGLKLLSLVLAAAMLAMATFVLGFTKPELRAITRFMWLGTVAVYVGVMNVLGRGASASVMGARSAAERARQRRAEAAERAAEQAAWEEQQALAAQHWAPEVEAAPAARPSFLSRIRRPVEPDYDPYDASPELFETEPYWDDQPPAAPTEDRIRARISQAVQNRKAAPVATDYAPEPAGAPLHHDMPETFAEPEPAPPRPSASVLAAVAKRLARGPRQPQVVHQEPPLRAEPQLRAEPPLRAKPRFMPGFGAPAATAPERASEMATYAEAEEPHMTAAEQVAQEREYAGEESRDWTHPDYEGFEPDLRDMRTEHFYAGEPHSFDETGNAQWIEEDVVPEIPASARGLDRQVIKQPEPKRVVQPAAKPAAPSRRAIEEAQPKMTFEKPQTAPFEMPPLSLLTNPTTIQRHQLSDEALEENARMLETVLDDYGVKGEIVSVRPGPVVTMYELEPAPGLKASRVIGLADDIARSMSALSARVSTVPGRSVIGIELPNDHREKVVLREILSARDFDDKNIKLPLALGKTIGGEPIVTNLAKMPHLLIAGTTGSGKSVAINTMILSLLYRLTPEECRLIMIDPKMLELSVYDGIPHLLSPVVTDPKKAVVALKWVVSEMEERYRKMSKMGVRNIEGYNGRVKESLEKGEMFKRTVQTGFDEETGEPIFETDEFQPEPFPYIVVIVDEMADLMMVAGKEIEACIQRLAQMARASGIHLIMATQRPSVDVITGTIKANFPTRISFQVTSKIDSRTILGEQGAEQLLGMGDMLYMAGGGKITRCHGPFVSDEEVEEIVNHLKSFGPPAYMSGVVEGPDDEVASDIDQVLGLNTGGNTGGEDALYDQAVGIVIKDRKCSTSYIQRKLGIGYNKAARLVEQMEDQGVVSSANHVGKREILVPEQQ
ncbi:cell division protein FtsK [Thioclava nitratireducens]|uniref:DNA translocase FtsK n=2 Tax=Thioclava TaxID=285107 RepID=A0ABN4XJU5_9RHOB|nr:MULTISPECIES: DNA translocase FtsK 4TM domain-containing protein [Thioclava]AQS49568.1 cell division protein FtsK [Thioclava nitratireducens]OWY07785.1 cell division protein FtsK [Thioclava sp. F42-5]